MGDIFGFLIVRPLGILLNIIYNAVGSYGLAVILFALLVKIIILPIAYHGKKGMLRMSKLQVKCSKFKRNMQITKLK